MKLFGTLLCAVLAALSAAPARACTDPGGIGGTGISADGGGIGGTGTRAEVDVGVLGVITGFGSICVNGVEVHYDAGTPVSANGEPASVNALAVGKVVSVQAVGSGTQARARTIHVVEAAIGVVSAVDAAGTLLQVHGQRVKIEPATILADGLTAQRLASAGESVRVSGLRSADGSIVATRIEPAAPGTRPLAVGGAPDVGAGRFLVQGYVSDIQAGQVRVGDLSFSAAPELGAQLARDRLVRIAGRTEGEKRVVERADVLGGPFNIRPERTLRFDVRRSSDAGERRGGRSDSGAAREDRSGRSGPDRPERVERPDRSGRSERPERIERSGGSSGRH